MKTERTANKSTGTMVDWLKRNRGSVVTLLAGVAILVVSATAGYLPGDDGAGIDVADLSIYLLAVLIVATQAGRLVRASQSLPWRSLTWVTGRSKAEPR